MGANFDYRSYESDDRKTIEKEWLADVESDQYDNRPSYSGSIGMLGPDIQWRSETFSTPEECTAFIESTHEKWEPPIAVAFDGGWVVGGWCSS